MRVLPLLLVFPLGLTLPAAGDWAQFRGPNQAGISSETGPPLTWTSDQNVLWKAPLPGYGASSPIVVGSNVFVTYYTDYGLDAKDPGDPQDLELHLRCLDVNSGKVRWTQDIDAQSPDEAYVRWLPEHGYASATPASDGNAVYTFFGKSGVHAFDLNGKKLWSKSAGSGTHGFGTAASPLLYENLVIVNACVESDALIAFDKKSGDEVWRSQGINRAWCSPSLVALENGRHEIVLSTEGAVFGFDPKSGERLWSCEGIDDYICPTVISHEEVVYAVGGRNKVKSLAVRAGGRGDVTTPHRLWASNEGSKVPSPLYHDGHLYFVQHTGIAQCLNAQMGEVVYKERLQGIGNRNKTYASPVLADGRLYYVTCYSGTFVIEAKPEFHQLAHNSLDDDSVFNASPAVTPGRLILRSDKAVYAIGKTNAASGG